jgi:hypothetical protein
VPVSGIYRGRDVGGLRALGALGDVELDSLVLGQATEAGRLDSGEVDEDVSAAAVDANRCRLVRSRPNSQPTCANARPLARPRTLVRLSEESGSSAVNVDVRGGF